MQPGQSLLRYRLVEKIGQGGMGVVWRAADANLDRDVAIKILPEEFAVDAARLARFEREAKLLASLSHPCIATVHSIEEAQGVRFLVLELVEGEDLAQRLSRGAVPLGETLDLAAQIAGALEAAHDAGVIHRDLKPANIRLTPAGRVKVLDFGLAKARAPVESQSDPSRSPTVTATGTAAGVILGTAAYMSPEQARGRPVDRRTDIWSFGVVLFECLAGRSLFQGETASDSLGAILHREPDWSALPPDTPPLVRHLLRRCLRKDRERRLRDAGDARIDLETAKTDPREELGGAPTEPGSSGRRGVLRAGVVLLALAAGAVIGWAYRASRDEPPASPTIGFSIDLSTQGLSLQASGSNLALDASGTMVAFAALRGGEQRVFVRPLANSGGARAIAGTEGGGSPFFSPDGRWLGFLRDGKLIRVPANGGPALTICELCQVDPRLADPVWLDDGTIVYVGGQSATLERIHAADGARQTLAASDPEAFRVERAITGFDSPARVPGRPYVLASVYYDVTIEDYDVVAVSLEDGSVRWVLSNATEPRFLPPGRLLFSRESSLYAVPFDPRRGVVTGEAELIVDGVLTDAWADNAQYGVAANGTLAYVPGRRLGPGRNVIRVETSGRSEELLPHADALLGDLRVSPDGTKLLLNTLRRRAEVWAFDLQRRSFDLITNVAPSYNLVWMPDGTEVVYLREGYGGTPTRILRHALGAAGDGRPIGLQDARGGLDSPHSVSPDGTILLMNRLDSTGGNGLDIMMFRLDQEGRAEPLVATPANEEAAVFSPDGAWFAYESDESGRSEVYVRRFPDSGRRWQVSVDGGRGARWARDGTKLYFVKQRALFVSRLHTGDGFVAEVPAKLMDLSGISAPFTGYDVLPDDSVVLIRPAPWEREGRRIEVAVHWDGRSRARGPGPDVPWPVLSTRATVDGDGARGKVE